MHPLHLVALDLLCGLGSLLESTLESAGQVLLVAHAAGSRCLPSQGLHAPVVLAEAGSGVATSGTHALLDVEGPSSAPHADHVALVVALSIT